MKPAPFDLLLAESVKDATSALAEHGEAARIIAGGQSLMAMLNMRLTEPSVLIDISRIGGMDGITVDATGITVGATVRQAELAAHKEAMAALPLLAEALSHVGHLQTRNRGTVCGSLAHADPSAELPLCLVLLGGSVKLASAQGEREVAAEDFLLGTLSTARRPDEMIVSARFPVPPAGAKTGFVEVSRRHGDFAIVALACIAKGSSVRLAVGGVADAPVAVDLENVTPDTLPAELNALAWRLGGYDDIHATARYRRELIRRLGRNLILEAIA
jgi:2-furoyl-CoA dehydrogenase FAD binding subunit